MFAGFESTPTESPTLTFRVGDAATQKSLRAEHAESGTPNLAKLGASVRMKSANPGDRISLALAYQLVSDDTNYFLVHERAEEDKSMELPELQKISQMLAAGWGGFGSVLTEIPFKGLASHRTLAHISLGESVRASFDAFSSSPKRNPVRFSMRNDYLDDLHDVKPPKAVMSMSEAIKLANAILRKPDDLNHFVQAIQNEPLDHELKSIFEGLIKTMSLEKAWLSILAWLLAKFELVEYWESDTRLAIKELVETSNPHFNLETA